MNPNLSIKLYAIECVDIGSWWNFAKVNSSFTRLFYSQNANGKTWIQHNGDRRDINSDTFIIAPPFTEVNYICEETCELYGLIFTAEIFSGIQVFSLDGVNHTTPADDLLIGSLKRLLKINPGIEVPEADPFKQSYNESILNLSTDNADLPIKTETNAILQLLVSRFLTNETSLYATNSSPAKQRILKILEYIDQNLDQPLSLEILAEHVGLNPTYLSNHFSEFLKIRPTTYIKRKRIERAQHQLVTTHKPLKQISYEIGIPNTDYFFQVFKKELGCTPSEYRNRHTTDSSRDFGTPN